MPTENRRVAAYLPKNIDDRLEAFKAERGLKGDSPALIAILSEFLGVSQEVAYQSDPSIQLQQIEQLKGELLSELQSKLFEFRSEVEQRLQNLEEKVNLTPSAKVELELLSELDEESLGQQEVPGQLKLIPVDEEGTFTNQADELLSDLESESQDDAPQKIQPLSESALAKRLGVTINALRQVKTKDKKVAGSFARWSRSKDDDGIAWEYDPQTKLFQPAF